MHDAVLSLVLLVAVGLRGGLVGQLGKVWVDVDPSTAIRAVLTRQSSPKVEAKIDETGTFHAVKAGDEMKEGDSAI